MKKILALSLFISIVTGCSYLDSRSSTNPISENEQLCSELKREIVFNTTSVRDLGAASATQQAQSLRLYEKYGCGKFEKKS